MEIKCRGNSGAHLLPIRCHIFEKLGVSKGEIEQIHEALALFDTDGGSRIDQRELKAALSSLGFESKNPTIYAITAYLYSHENANGIDFEHFLEAST